MRRISQYLAVGTLASLTPSDGRPNHGGAGRHGPSSTHNLVGRGCGFRLAKSFAQRECSRNPPLGPLLQPATEATTATTPVEPEPPTIAEKRAENAELVRVAERKVESDPANAAAAAELAAYKTSRDAARPAGSGRPANRRFETSRGRACEGAQRLERRRRGSRPKSISFVEFDRLVNRLAAEQARTELVRSKLKAAKAAIEQAQTRARMRGRRTVAKRRKRMTAGKTVARGGDAGRGGRRSRSGPAASPKTRRRCGRRNSSARSSPTRSRSLTVELLKGKVDRFQPLVVFTEANLQEQLQKLKGQEETVRDDAAARPKTRRRPTSGNLIAGQTATGIGRRKR